jgi:ribonucleoside-diphosphate reductase alpha chain
MHPANVRKRDGASRPFEYARLAAAARRAAIGLSAADPERVAADAARALYEDVPTREIQKALVLSARALVPLDPDYSRMAARLLLASLYREAFGHKFSDTSLPDHYRLAFCHNVHRLIEAGRLDPRLAELDLGRLSVALRPERDLDFRYLGVQTLYDRYLLHVDGQRLETPQAFWMRVAMGLSLNDPDPTAAALATYEMLSTFRYCHSTPTLFNAGTRHPQLSSCYLSTVEDSIDGIYGTLHAQARLSKYAGGLGVDLTPLRSTGGWIRGTNGPSQGVIPWAKQFSDMAVAVNQGSKRKGAVALYLECWHHDFPDWLDLRRNTGDERRRAHDVHPVGWAPDLFFRRIQEGGEWTLFNPDEVPGLHDAYGHTFDALYAEYERKADAGEIRVWRRLNAKELWKKWLTALHETGHPWVTFKDPANLLYPDDHAGVVHSSNLCCVAGDQRVVTDRGLVRVADLAAEGGSLRVVGRDGVQNASEMARTIRNSPLVEVRTREGFSHKVTPDHPLWVVDRGWVEARDLQAGDRVEIQQVEGLWGPTSEVDLAFLCGFVAGDGCFTEHTVCIDLWEHKGIHRHEVEAMVARVLDRHAEKYRLRTNSTDRPAFALTTDGRKGRLTSAPLAAVLGAFGFSAQTKLRVPEFVWRGDRDTVSAYLRGLFLVDGTTQASPAGLTTASLASVSEDLLKEVQILLANFGIKSRLTTMRPAGYNSLPDGRGGHRDYPTAPAYRLLVTSTHSCRKLEAATGIGKARQDTTFLANLHRSGYAEKRWARVVSVKPLPNEDVYCLMVDSPDRAWTCNGLVTKNTEILLHTAPTTWNEGRVVATGQTAVCNLASLNWAAHIDADGNIDLARVAQTVRHAIRTLDRVIDLNFYPIPEAANANLAHRPIGLGDMGWADLLHARRIAPDSPEARELADTLGEFVLWHAVLASAELAAERGAYPAYAGSRWSRGLLPGDSWAGFLREHRGVPDATAEGKMDWELVRAAVARHGMRNSNVRAVAPTATIAGIVGCSESVAPDPTAVFSYGTISGNFVVLNEWLVRRLKELGRWSEETANALLAVDGDVSLLDGIPDDLRHEYRTAWDLDQHALIDVAAARQKWVDMGQSLNLFCDTRSLRELHELYFHAWQRGLKTTYYLKARAVSRAEKTTIPAAPRACSLEARARGVDCEACQ